MDRTGTTHVRLRFASNSASTAYLFVTKGTRATVTIEDQ